MNSIAVSSLVFACVLGGAGFGMFLRAALPQHHLSVESKDAVRLVMGLVATVSALVLSLLIASAKSAYDVQRTGLTEMSAKVVLLDRVLAHYGPESKEARALLRTSVVRVLDQMWTKNDTSTSKLEPSPAGAEILFDKIQEFSPKDDAQRFLQAQALNIAMGVAETRWLMYAQATVPRSTSLLMVLVFWLTALFISFGLFSPRNGTVVASLFISALSISGAILLFLELYSPYGGMIQISSGPLRTALASLGQ